MAEQLVQKMVTEDSFDARGSFVPAGQIGAFDPSRLNGKEAHLFDASDFPAPVQVEQSAIAPTGPNPTVPQQIPPDARQAAGGAYVRPGVTLTAERTPEADERLAGIPESDETVEGDMADALREAREETARLRAELEQTRQSRETAHRVELAGVATTSAMLDEPAANGQNGDDALVEGNIADVTAKITADTSDADLAALEAAENDRERPRKGVLSAIEAERERRKGASNA
jgi:hypothetical protein